MPFQTVAQYSIVLHHKSISLDRSIYIAIYTYIYILGINNSVLPIFRRLRFRHSLAGRDSDEDNEKYEHQDYRVSSYYTGSITDGEVSHFIRRLI